MIFQLLYVFFCFYFADVAYTCTLPKDSGSCDNKIFRYYYNAIEVCLTKKYDFFMILKIKKP